ncbi:Transcription initiation factor TFIID subunit 2 [Abortiporus biennis]
MQREHLRRGFTIYVHQKVVLEIDFSGSIWGYTELTVVPQTKDLRTIHLHSRQCTIHSVTVASHSADFVHHDPLANISISNPQDCHNHLELKRKLYSALAEGDEGELSIAIPREVVKQSGHSVAGVVSEAATPEPQTPGPSLQTSAPQPEFVPIVVCITYSLRNPSDGLQFVVPNDTYPFRVPHMYTTPSSPDAARCWVPCIDNLWEKCTWEFEFVVPRHLEQHDALSDDEDEDSQEVDYPTVVVCSGELVEQVSHPHNSAKTIFVFAQSTLTSVQHIAFAAGPFHVHTIPADLSTAEDASGTTQPLMHAFCLPGHEAMLSQSVSCMRSAMSFYSSEFGSYPFGSHKLVFVDELPTQRFDSATLSLVTVDLLHGDDAIDQVFEARHSLGHALACQWIGINIVQKTWSDTWLVNGLGLYITGLFMRKVFGNNEYRFRLKKDMERVVEMDMGAMPPICQPQCLDPPDSFTLPFVNLKAPLVLHILDRRLGKSGTSLGLSRVLPKIFLSAISGEMPNNAISTHAFLRTCRKVSGIDPRSFAEQWIYGSGCPVFGFSATFNRKKMAVEITMRQDAPAYKVLENNEINKTLLKPVPFFEGQMTIRIHEADGTPYEHVLDIRSPVKRYEVPFNTKYKRVRRNTKRYLARQQAAQAAAEGDAEAAAAMDMVDMGFGLDIWEKEKERENWKVADWTEEDEQNMSGQTYEWIRIDADFEWIAAIAFDQKDYMWVSQLQRDRDVVAQYEAISVLAKNPSAIISSNFTRTVLVTNYYYRIRCEAALALVTCAVQRLDWLGLFHLFKLFLRYCYEPDDPNQDLFTHSYVPRPNDFSDFAEYFVRKSLVQAISRVRFGNGKTPPVVRQFLIDQLRYNDNTSNSFSDALYICTVISSLTCAIVSTVPPERGEFIDTESRPALDAEDANLLRQAVTEIDRYRSMDRLIPSPHNVVTVATIEFYLTLGLASLVPLDPRIFFPMTREGNFTQVRMAAFDALFLCKWYTTKVMQYVLAVMAHDSSRVIRRHVARNACQSLALLVTMGEMKTSVKESESLLIEEDGTPQENKKESKKSDMDIVIKALRKDREVGKNEAIREFLIPIAMAPDADIEVRWCLLKLADLLIRPSEEVPPKVTIHLPPTPVVETPPALPKVSLKTHKALKSATPSIKSPLTPFTIPPKLKLPPSAPNADALMRTPSTASTPTVDRKAPTFTVPKPPKKVTDKVPLIAKPPAPKKVPQARTSGMSQSDLSACRTAVKKMQTNKSAAVFLQPVDPVRDRAPNYFDIIKNPMDISTMSAKLEQGQYKDRFAFEADFRLMIANAKQYNMPMSFVHNEAVKLEAFFDKLWVRINKTLEAADKAHAKSVSVPIATSVTPRPTVPSRAIATPIPQTPTPASSRPIIKLKVGGASLNGSPAPTPSETPQLPLPRPKLKKVKEKPPVESHASTSETAYFDDGSADLLEEVIAIEREKSAERRLAKERSKEQERPKEKEKLVIGKRKKPSTESKTSEDEILSLAAPAKKERSSSYTPPIAGPSTIPAKPPEPSKSSTSASGSGRNSVSSHKTKEKPQKVSTAPPPLAPEPVPAQEVPRVSIKGKEKDKGRDREKEKERGKEREKDKSKEKEKERSKEREKEKEKEKEKAKEKEPVHSAPPPVVPKKKSPPQVNTPAKSKGSSSSTPSPAATPINEKKCREVLKILMKLPDARIFLIPVDPVRDGCPTYYDEIKNPMDFGSMSTKLTEHAYVTMEEFAADVDLIFKNCRTFNPPTTYPVNCADALDRVFKKEWAKAMEKKLAWNEKRSLQSIMNKLVQDPISWVFREPVDPVLLGIPTYHDVIPKSKARDLKTIRQKLEIDKYDTVEAFEADLDLMVNNAILFNGAESEVGKIAKLVRDKYRELLSSVRTTTSTKRKSEKGTPQPSKKQKMS